MKNRTIYFCAHAEHFKEFDHIRDLVHSKQWKDLKEWLKIYSNRVFKFEGYLFDNSKEFNRYVQDYYYKFKIKTTKDLD